VVFWERNKPRERIYPLGERPPAGLQVRMVMGTHSFASGEAFRTSLKCTPHMPQQFLKRNHIVERNHAFVRSMCV
jgi:hypothetical protein